jgi:hypothetical protein
LAIIGGRSDNLVEYILRVPVLMSTYPDLSTKLNALTREIKSSDKPPGGRKNHVSVSTGDLIVVHGGETFDGRAKAAVADTWVLDLRGGGLRWMKVCRENAVARAGHGVCVVKDAIFIHGGFDAKGKICNEVIKLDL